MTGFIPHSSAETQAMLADLGLKSLDDLFADIPLPLRKLPEQDLLALEGLDELSLQQRFQHLANNNWGAQMISFQGGGAYHRFIPPAVNHIASRSEFYTAYTPYQPEISQGTLQVIFEFQTMMANLTGMEVCNASVYDFANAFCEAALMAARITKKSLIVLSQSIHPHAKEALETYVRFNTAITLKYINPTEAIEEQLSADELKDLAAVIVQNPDYFGVIADATPLGQFCKQHKAMFVVAVDVMSLALLKSPAAMGADIVCGDIQQFGNSVNYGGPYGGFIATKKDYMRQLPGRLVSQTTDSKGQVVYTLALQTREQHIRRSKATSNICTNQSLNVLKATIYLSLVGASGLKQLATLSAERAHQLADELGRLPGVHLKFPQSPFLNEFTVCLPIPAKDFIAAMARQHGVIPGIDLGQHDARLSNCLLVAATEMTSPHHLKAYLDSTKEVLYRVEPANIAHLPPAVSSKTYAQMPPSAHF